MSFPPQHRATQCTALSAAMRGIEAMTVEVEVDVAGGLPGVTMVGLADGAVRESRVRVESAIKNTGLVFPVSRITVNLAPAHIKKDGSGFDLPIALAILAAAGAIEPAQVDKCLMLGELSLTGDVRPVRGALAAAEAAKREGHVRVLVARENAEEAALVDGVDVHAVSHLKDAVAFLQGHLDRAPLVRDSRRATPPPFLDLADVRGQFLARRGLELAAAGGHNILFVGGPGAGKTMLARRLAGILPPLHREQALEVTRVHSAAGLNIGGGLIDTRPFRAPHHSITPAGLVGGGSAIPRPGEMTLAHHGVLFLDELPEFARHTLESLREPLEAGEVGLSRASGTIRYPAQTLLVASMNPCPCGYLKATTGRRRCTCSPQDVHRYQARISGPLLDRIDMYVHVDSVDLGALEDEAPGESSAVVRERVLRVRERQAARYGRPCTNALASNAEVRRFAWPDAAGRRALAAAVAKGDLSARSYERVIRVARTIADADGAPAVTAKEISQALMFHDENAVRGATRGAA